MIIHDVDQNSPEWDALRLAIPTASMFATVMAKTPKGDGPGKTRQTYMRKLAGERITNQPAENYTNSAMERGHIMEDEARETYRFVHGVEPERVGFITDDKHSRGASPDSLIGNDGVLEIKSKVAHLLIEEIEKNRPPPEHIAQVQGQLWIAEREWADLVLYWPGLPLVPHRITRDEAYIANLAAEVERFNEELAALVERVRRFGVTA